MEPPDISTWKHNRDNVETFMQTVLAKDLIHKQLTDYIWNSWVAQIQEERHKKRPRIQVQKGGVVYSADIDRKISTGQELIVKWETNLTTDQKVYLLVLQSTVLPQLLLRTKKTVRS